MMLLIYEGILTPTQDHPFFGHHPLLALLLFGRAWSVPVAIRFLLSSPCDPLKKRFCFCSVWPCHPEKISNWLFWSN